MSDDSTTLVMISHFTTAGQMFRQSTGIGRPSSTSDDAVLVPKAEFGYSHIQIIYTTNAAGDYNYHGGLSVNSSGYELCRQQQKSTG